MGKPKVDEYLMHYRNIVNIMKRHKRILVYAMPGEGKSTLLRGLEKKFSDEWNFYEFGYSDEFIEPFIYELSFAFLPEDSNITIPEKFDLIYSIQYSKEYKEAVSGVSFGDEYRPLADYLRKRDMIKMGKRNLAGKRFKSLKALQDAIQGVE